MPGNTNNTRGGSGRRKGRGGKGKSNATSTKSKANKRQHLFQPDGQNNAQFHTFDETLSQMVTKMRTQELYSNSPAVTASIAAVKNLPPKKPRDPTLKVEGDITKGYDEMDLHRWKGEQEAYTKSKIKFENLLKTAAAVIFTDYCTTQMKTKLRGLSDFTSAVELDPITMLERILQLVLHSQTHQQCTVQRLKRLQNALNPTQLDNERVDMYLSRVDGDIDQLISMIGNDFITAGVKKSNEYTGLDPDEQVEMLDASIQ